MGLMNKFASFQQLQDNAVGAIRRFPLALLSGVVGTITAIILIEYHDQESEFDLLRLLLTSGLGIPLFIALVLTAEKGQWRRSRAWIVQGIAVAHLVAYFFSLPDGLEDCGSCLLRFALLALGLHFLVACQPYFRGNQTHGFWHYNMSLFHRLLTSAAFSAVMYVGLAIALAAGDHLFGFDVEPERFFQLWVIMVGIFNTWVFLAGVPKDLEALDQATDYPKGLAVFAQYILLPLVALYFVILIAYEAKIIIEWNWPKGWVSELVLWFSVVGLLSLLALYPLRKQEGKRWVQTFVKWFFRAMIPLVAMLLLAILRRISDYGVTEPRYLVLAMAVGLVIVTLYFLISKSRDIRIIPILLAVVCFLSAYGPWSASSVSLRSQQGRLEMLLTQNGMLVDGSIVEAEQGPSFEDRKQMSSIIGYIWDWHGRNQFAKWLGEDAIDSLYSQNQYAQQREVADKLGFEPVDRYDQPEPASVFSISADGDRSIANLYPVTGFDYLVDFSLQTVNDFHETFPIGPDSCFVSFDMADLALNVYIGNNRDDSADAMRFQLSDALDSLIARYDDKETPVGDRSFVLSGNDFEAKLVLEYVFGEKEDGDVQLGVFVGHLLLRRR